MDWNAIGAAGEIRGASAAVITLLYLSKQIRLNSQAVRVAALRDTTAQWTHWSELLASSPGLAEIVARGKHSYKNLPAADALRYGAFVQMFYDNVESSLTLARVHDAVKDVEIVENIARRRIGITGFTEWLEENTEDYDAEFIGWISKLREQAR